MQAPLNESKYRRIFRGAAERAQIQVIEYRSTHLSRMVTVAIILMPTAVTATSEW